MSTSTSSGLLQAATTIAKTTETIIGAEIGCAGYDWITLFFAYVNGDETGVYIVPYVMSEASGTAYQHILWSETAGVYSAEQVKYTATATLAGSVTLSVKGIEFIKFMQGGSANDGTPTGTLAASYSMSKE